MTKRPSKLFEAIEQLDSEQVKSLIDSGADVNQANAEGDTPLHCVAQRAEERAMWPIVSALLGAGADPSRHNIKGKTPHKVALETMRAVCEQTGHWLYAGGSEPPAEKEPSDGPYQARLVFHAIAREHTRQVVQESDPALCLQDWEGRTGLHHAVWAGDADKVRQWIDGGGLLGPADDFSYTATLTAANQGNDEILQLLTPIHTGWIYDRTNHGKNAVHLAVESGSAEAVKVLVQQAAELSARAAKNTAISEDLDMLFNDDDDDGFAPLDRLVERTVQWRREGANEAGDAVVIGRSLVSAGADPDEAQNNAPAPVVYAARIGHAGLCRVLLRGSTKIQRLEFGRKVLCDAIGSGCAKTVSAVLEVNTSLAQRLAMRGEQPMDVARERLETLFDQAQKRAAKPQSSDNPKDVAETVSRLKQIGAAKAILTAVEEAAKKTPAATPAAAAGPEPGM